MELPWALPKHPGAKACWKQNLEAVRNRLRQFDIEPKDLERALSSRASSFGQLLFRSDVLRTTSKAVFDSLCASATGNNGKSGVTGKTAAFSHNQHRDTNSFTRSSGRHEEYVREIFSSALWVQRIGDPANKQFHARSHARSAIITLVLGHDWKGCVSHAQMEQFAEECRTITTNADEAQTRLETAETGNFAALAFRLLQGCLRPTADTPHDADNGLGRRTSSSGKLAVNIATSLNLTPVANSAQLLMLLKSVAETSGCMDPGALAARRGFPVSRGEVSAVRQLCRFLAALAGFSTGPNPADEGETTPSMARTPTFGSRDPVPQKRHSGYDQNEWLPSPSDNDQVRQLALECLVNYAVVLWDANMMLRLAEHLSIAYFQHMREMSERGSSDGVGDESRRSRSDDLRRRLNAGADGSTEAAAASSPKVKAQQGDSKPATRSDGDANAENGEDEEATEEGNNALGKNAAGITAKQRVGESTSKRASGSSVSSSSSSRSGAPGRRERKINAGVVNLGQCIYKHTFLPLRGKRMRSAKHEKLHSSNALSQVIQLEVRRCHGFTKSEDGSPATRGGGDATASAGSPWLLRKRGLTGGFTQTMSDCLFSVVAVELQLVCRRQDSVADVVAYIAETVNHSPALTKVCFDGVCYPPSTLLQDVPFFAENSSSVDILGVVFSPSACASLGGTSTLEHLWLRTEWGVDVDKVAPIGVPAYAGEARSAIPRLSYEDVFGQSADGLSIDFRDSHSACASHESIPQGDAAVLLFATALRMAGVARDTSCHVVTAGDRAARQPGSQAEPTLPPRDEATPSKGASGDEAKSLVGGILDGADSNGTGTLPETGEGETSPLDSHGWHSVLHVLVEASAGIDLHLRGSDEGAVDFDALDSSLQLAAYSLRLLQHSQSMHGLRDLWDKVGASLRLRVLRSAFLAIDFQAQVVDNTDSAAVAPWDSVALPRLAAYRTAWTEFLHLHFCFIVGNPLDCASFLLGLVQSLFRATIAADGRPRRGQPENIPIYLFGEHLEGVRLTASLLHTLENEVNLVCLPEFWSQLCKYVHASPAMELKTRLARLQYVGNILLSLVTSVGVWVADVGEWQDGISAGHASNLRWSRAYKSLLLQALMNMQRSVFGAMQHTLLSDDPLTATHWQAVLNGLSSRFFTELSVFLEGQELATVGQILAVAMIWIFNVQQLHSFFHAHFFRNARLCSSILQLLLVIKASASDRLLDAQCSLADILSRTAVEAILATLRVNGASRELRVPSAEAAASLKTASATPRHRAPHESFANVMSTNGDKPTSPTSLLLSSGTAPRFVSFFVSDETRRGADSAARVWCASPLFAGGLNSDHLRQVLVAAQQPSSPEVRARKGIAKQVSIIEGVATIQKDPIALVLAAIDVDAASTNNSQIAATHLAHVKLAQRLTRLSLNPTKRANDSPGVALTLLRGVQEQVALPASDLRKLLKHKCLESCVLHIFACLLIHAVDDPLASSYKLMMKSGTVAQGTAELMRSAMGFGLRILRETAAAATAVSIKQTQAAQAARAMEAGAIRSKARGALMVGRSQSDTTMSLRDRLAKVNKNSSGGKLKGTLSSLLNGAGGEATSDGLLGAVCQGVIADCDFFVRLLQPANLSPATRLRFGSNGAPDSDSSGDSLGAGIGGSTQSLGQQTKVGASNVLAFMSRRLHGLHQWILETVKPKAPYDVSGQYHHLAKVPRTTGPEAVVNSLWCEADDVRLCLVAQCHKGGLRVYALNTFDALLSSLVLPQQVRLILMRLLESLSASWRTLTGHHRGANGENRQPLRAHSHRQQHGREARQEGGVDGISPNHSAAQQQHHQPASAKRHALNSPTQAGPTLMHHLDGLGGCGLAVERCVTSAYFRVLSRVVHCFQYGEPSQQLLTLPLLGVTCRTEDDWKQIQEAGILNILASLVGQKRKEAIEEYEHEVNKDGSASSNSRSVAESGGKNSSKSRNKRAATMEIVALGAPSEEVLKFLGTHAVTSISAGERNAAFVTAGGQVFAHGLNIAGSCGTGNGRSTAGGASVHPRDSMSGVAGIAGFPFEPIVEPRHLQAVAGTRVVRALVGGDMLSPADRVAKGALGISNDDRGTARAGASKDAGTNDFIVLLSASGTVFTAGANDYGQLGRGVGAPTSDTPVVVPGLAKYRISHITVGWHHVIAVSNGPPLDTRGAFGVNPTNNASSTAYAASADGTGFSGVTQFGTILTWGKNDCGQLGLGYTSNQEWSPRTLAPLFGDRLAGVRAVAVTMVAAGATHSLVSCTVQTDSHDHHMVVGWGSNSKGQLGAADTLLSCHDIGSFSNDDSEIFAADAPLRPLLAQALLKLRQKQQRKTQLQAKQLQQQQQQAQQQQLKRPKSFGNRLDFLGAKSSWMGDDSASGAEESGTGGASGVVGRGSTRLGVTGVDNNSQLVLQPAISSSFAFNHVAVQDVCCGSFHSAVLTTCGTVFCFGSNEVCQCQPQASLGDQHPLVQSLAPAPSAPAAAAARQLKLKVLPAALPGPAKSVALGRHYTVAVVANDKNSNGSSPAYSFWSRSDAYIETHAMLQSGAETSGFEPTTPSKQKKGVRSVPGTPSRAQKAADTEASTSAAVVAAAAANKKKRGAAAAGPRLSETQLFLLYFFIRCGLPPHCHQRYLVGFTSAGFSKASQLQQLDDPGLRRMGVVSTGHRRLMLQQISAEAKAADVVSREDVWGWGLVPRQRARSSEPGGSSESQYQLQDAFCEPTLLLTRDIKHRNTPWSELFSGASHAIFILQLPPSSKLSKEATLLALKRRLSTGTWAVFQMLAINTARFSNYTHGAGVPTNLPASADRVTSSMERGAAVAAEDAVLDCLMHELTELAAHQHRDICTGLMHDVLKLLHKYCVISHRAVSRLANKVTIALLLRMIMARESADVVVQCIHFIYILLPIAGPETVAQIIVDNPDVWPVAGKRLQSEDLVAQSGDAGTSRGNADTKSSSFRTPPRRSGAEGSGLFTPGSAHRFPAPLVHLVSSDGRSDAGGQPNSSRDKGNSFPSPSYSVPPSVAASFWLQLIGHGLYRPPVNVHEDVAEQEDVVMAASGSLCGSRIDLIAASEIVVLVRKLLDPTGGIPGFALHAAQWASAINEALQEALCKPVQSHSQTSRLRVDSDNIAASPSGDFSPRLDTPGSVASSLDTDGISTPSQMSARRKRSSSFVPRSENRRQALGSAESYSHTDFERDSLVVQRIWRLLGALCVLGGDTEVLRDQCKVRLFLPSGVKKPARVFRYNAWSAAVALGEDFNNRGGPLRGGLAQHPENGSHTRSKSVGNTETKAGGSTLPGAQSQHYNYKFDRDIDSAVTINLEDVQIEVVQQVPVPIEHVLSKGNLLFSIHQLLLGTHPVQAAAPLSHSSSSELSTSFTAVSQLFLQQTRMRSCKALGYLLHDDECLTTAIDNGYIDVLTKITQHENPHAVSLRSPFSGSAATGRQSVQTRGSAVDDPGGVGGASVSVGGLGVGSRANEYALEHRWIELQHQRSKFFKPLARIATGSAVGSGRVYHLHVQLAEMVGIHLFDTYSSAPEVFCAASIVHAGDLVSGGVPIGSKSPIPVSVRSQFSVPVTVPRPNDPEQLGHTASVDIPTESGTIDFLVNDLTSAVLCIDTWVRSNNAGDGVLDEEEKRKCRSALPVKCQFLGQAIVPVYQVLLSDIEALAPRNVSTRGGAAQVSQMYRFPLSVSGVRGTNASLHGAIGLGLSVSVPSARDAEFIRKGIQQRQRQQRQLPLERALPAHVVGALAMTPTTGKGRQDVLLTGTSATLGESILEESGCFEKVDFNGLSLNGMCVLPALDAGVPRWMDATFPDDENRVRKVLGFADGAPPGECVVFYTHTLDFQNDHSFAEPHSEAPDDQHSLASAYLNRYTIVLDVWFSGGLVDTASDGTATDFQYTSLLQTSYNNGQDNTPGSWFLRSDGVPGCCKYGLLAEQLSGGHHDSTSESQTRATRRSNDSHVIRTYPSEQVRVQPEHWHRLVLTVDTLAHRLRFYVDGCIATDIEDAGLVLPDDRWALDKTFALLRDGADVTGCCPGPAVRIGSFQLRDYPMSPASVASLAGASVWGVPPPSNAESAVALCELLGNRYDISSCATALRATNYRRTDAIVWLRTHRRRLLHNVTIENKALAAGLGLSTQTVDAAFEESHGDAVDAILHVMADSSPLDDTGVDGEHNGDIGQHVYSLQKIQGRGDSQSDMYRIHGSRPANAASERSGLSSRNLNAHSWSRSVFNVWDGNYGYDAGYFTGSRRIDSIGHSVGAQTFHLRGPTGSVWSGDSDSAAAVNALATAVLRCTRQLVHSLAASAVMRMVINGSRRGVLSPFRAQLRRLLLDNRTPPLEVMEVHRTGEGKDAAQSRQNPAAATNQLQHTRSRFLHNFLDFLSDTLVRSRETFVRGVGGSDSAESEASQSANALSGFELGGASIPASETTTSPAMTVGALKTILKQELLLATNPDIVAAAAKREDDMPRSPAARSLRDAIGSRSPPQTTTFALGRSPSSMFRGSPAAARRILAESRLLTNVLAAEAILSMVSSFTMSSSIVAYPVTAWRCVWSGLGPKSASIWNPLPPPNALLGGEFARPGEAPGSADSKRDAGDAERREWVLLGDVATVGSAPPGSNSASSTYAFYGMHGAFARPIKFNRVWGSSSWDCNFTLWEMVPPKGYVSLGVVATLHGESPPGSVEGENTPYRCVRADLVREDVPQERLWSIPASAFDPNSYCVITAGNLGSTFCVEVSNAPAVENSGVGRNSTASHSAIACPAYHFATPPVLFNRHSESIAVWLLQLLISVSQARTEQQQQLGPISSLPASPTSSTPAQTASLDAPVLLSPHLVRTLWATAERALGAQGGLGPSGDGDDRAADAVLNQVSGLGLFRYKWLRLLSSVLRLSSHTSQRWGQRITDRYEDELDELFMTIADKALRALEKAQKDKENNGHASKQVSQLPEGYINGNFAWSSYVQTILELVVGTRIRSLQKADLDHVSDRDYLVSNDEDWLATEQWLPKYIECALLMQSLVDRNSPAQSMIPGAVPAPGQRLTPPRVKAASRLPASFLAGSDVFAPYFGVCEAQVIESKHPYPRDMESQQFDVKVPDANSLEIHFDPRCSTGPGDMLRLYLLEDVGENDGPSDAVTLATGNARRRAFAQREGHKSDFPKEPLLLKNIGERSSEQIVGISCEFPQRLAWGLKPVASNDDQASTYGAGISLEKGYRCASFATQKRGAPGQWRTVFGNVEFSHGHHYWEVRVDVCRSGRMMFGIGADGALENIEGTEHAHFYVGKDDLSWGWCTHGGSLWHAGQKELNRDLGGTNTSSDTYRVYGISKKATICNASEIDLPIASQRAQGASLSAIKAGDVVRVDLDLDVGTLSFSKNGVSLGVAFDDFVERDDNGVVVDAEHFFPGFSFFDPGDTITILSGSMPVAKVDNIVAAQASHHGDGMSKVPRVLGDHSRVQRTASGSWALDSSEVSELNLEKLERLVQLGFPRSACVQALQNYEFNVHLATEYLMTNADKFRDEERDRQMRKERQQAEQKAHQTASWIVQTMLDMEAEMKLSAAKSRGRAGSTKTKRNRQHQQSGSTAAMDTDGSSSFNNGVGDDSGSFDNMCAERRLSTVEAGGSDSDDDSHSTSFDGSLTHDASEPDYVSDTLSRTATAEFDALEEAEGAEWSRSASVESAVMLGGRGETKDASRQSVDAGPDRDAAAANAVSASEDDDEDDDEDEEDGSNIDGDDDDDDDDISSLDDDELQRYWGFKLLVVPMQLSGAAMASVVTKDQKRLIKLRVLAARWTLHDDEQLVAFVCEWARARGFDPLRVVPNEIRLADVEACAPRYTAVAAFPEREVQLRLLFLQAFNRRVRQLLPLIDLSCDRNDSALADNVRVLRGIIFMPVKETIWKTTLRLSQSEVAVRPTVLVDRMGALGALSEARSEARSRPGSPAASAARTGFGSPGGTDAGAGGETSVAGRTGNRAGVKTPSGRTSSNPVFLQLFEQLNSVDPSRMRHCERGYIVSMLGEHADDSGGPYREALDVACRELQSSRLPIFIPCPNQRDDVGTECRDAWMPNPNSEALVSTEQSSANSRVDPSPVDAAGTAVQQTQSTRILDYLEFLGKLMGIALRTGCHNSGLVLRFPRIVWKYLVQAEVTFDDVCQYDKIIGDRVQYIENIINEIEEEVDEDDDEERANVWLEYTEELDLRHCVMGADGVEHELFPGGKEVLVQWGTHREYLQSTKSYRLREVELQCEAMARGIATQVPRAILSLFTPQELEVMVCGEATVDLSFLRKMTEYVEPLLETDDVVRFFWEVLESFNQDELGLYLRFIWGRSRLPARSSGGSDNSTPSFVHKICFLETDESSDPDAFMPVGHTCFLRIDLPNYSSAAVLRRQLLYAITHTQCIDADEGTTAERQAQAAYSANR